MVVRAVAVMFLGTIVGCFPYIGRSQKGINRDSLEIRNAESGQIVKRALLLPIYGETMGFSSCGGHGPESMTSRQVLSDPMEYALGGKLDVPQPLSWGIVFGLFWAYFGKGWSIDGIIVLSPGYAPRFVWELWSDREVISITPISKEEWDLIGKNIVDSIRDGKLHIKFPWIEREGIPLPLVVEYDKEEANMVMRWLCSLERE